MLNISGLPTGIVNQRKNPPGTFPSENRYVSEHVKKRLLYYRENNFKVFEKMHKE